MDHNQRFMLPERGVRGQLVQLDAAWQAVRGKADYPRVVADLLGEALAATAALSGLIKFDGTIIFQLQGQGAVRLLLAQVSNQGDVRGLARHDEIKDAAGAAELMGESARLVMTIDGEDRERYQGIVAADPQGIAATVEAYFMQSEQLPTRIWLAVDGQRISAFLLQQLPGERQSDAARKDDWAHVTALADTLTQEELLQLPAEQLLHRLYHEEAVHVFSPKEMQFACGCSKAKVQAAIRGMGQVEADALVVEQGDIRADCEFCGQRYRFDAVDVAAIFKLDVAPASSVHH